MKISPAEIIDRLSIVKLKMEVIQEPSLKKEYEALKAALEEFKNEGVKIKEEWINELYEINKEEWDLLEQMFKERAKKETNYAKIGGLYLETEKVNKKRADVKNRIIDETGKGFREIKKNHPSAWRF